MITQAKIGKQLNLFIEKAISVDDLEDWLALHSWNMHVDSSEEAQKLAWAIELNLSEYSSGHLDDDELRAELTALVPMNPGVELRRSIDISPGCVLETGSGEFIESFPTQSWVHADIEFAVASW